MHAASPHPGSVMIPTDHRFANTSAQANRQQRKRVGVQLICQIVQSVVATRWFASSVDG
jgi:hypothetical protein